MQFTRPLHRANVSFSALNTANWKKANRFPTLLAQPLGTAEAWRIDMAEFYEEKKKKEQEEKQRKQEELQRQKEELEKLENEN